MNYTNTILFALWVLGIILHNLVEMNKINKAAAGNINLWQYLKLERFAILISLFMSIVAILAKQEITQLENVGKWLGLGFMAGGYMGQSLLIWFLGKASKSIDKPDGE